MTGHRVGAVTVLTNPASGHGNAPHAAERAIARLHSRGVDAVEIVGRDAVHARQLLRDALDRGTDALVVVGGDGVISLALQELAGGDVPLGVVPAGTGNDHARAFGVPTGDPAAAADVVADGHTQTVDLGRIVADDGTAKWFGTVVATGFDSLVSDRANRMRWPHGRMRYNVAMIAELSQAAAAAVPVVVRRRRAARHRIDDGRVRQHAAVTAAACSSARAPTRPTACSTSP